MHTMGNNNNRDRLAIVVYGSYLEAIVEKTEKPSSKSSKDIHHFGHAQALKKIREY